MSIIDGDGGNGSMTVRAMSRFDREDPSVGKTVYIPIMVSDNGNPQMTEKRFVPIVIGDQVRF